MRLVVTREDYFTEAMAVIARDGHAALKIGPLCRAIGVTSGSFYHYFDGWDGFVTDLLTHWERRQTQRVVALESAPAEPIARIRTLKRLVVDLPHDAEAAIRAWSHTDPTVAAVQARVDDERHRALLTLIVALVPNRRRAALLATMGMSLLVGLQQWRVPVDTRELSRLLDEYEALIELHASALVP